MYKHKYWEKSELYRKEKKKKKMYVPEKDFVPHFYTQAKRERKNTCKTKPLISQGIWPFFVSLEGSGQKQTKKKKKKKKERERKK